MDNGRDVCCHLGCGSVARKRISWQCPAEFQSSAHRRFISTAVLHNLILHLTASSAEIRKSSMTERHSTLDRDRRRVLSRRELILRERHTLIATQRHSRSAQLELSWEDTHITYLACGAHHWFIHHLAWSRTPKSRSKRCPSAMHPTYRSPTQLVVGIYRCDGPVGQTTDARRGRRDTELVEPFSSHRRKRAAGSVGKGKVKDGTATVR